MRIGFTIIRSFGYLDYRGTYGELTGNYSYSRYQRLAGAGVKGMLVATGDGLTVGQPSGDTL
ncbi:TPA: fimbria/pilus outer membrane usher protein, partial [Salmonella enterica]